MPSAPAIGFEYHPSRYLRRALIVIGGLAVLALWQSALPPAARIVASVLVMFLTAHAARRVARSPVRAAGCGADGQWTLHLQPQADVAATLLSSRVLSGFVLLRLRTAEHGVQTLLLGPDNADADIRRRLRMRLATMQAGTMPPGDGPS
ncbi:MAG: protein YgfX [Rhodanobacter sp.]